MLQYITAKYRENDAHRYFVITKEREGNLQLKVFSNEHGDHNTKSLDRIFEISILAEILSRVNQVAFLILHVAYLLGKSVKISLLACMPYFFTYYALYTFRGTNHEIVE